MRKILLFTDIHGEEKYIKIIIKKARFVDFSICAGDISLFSINLDKIITKLKQINSLLFLVPGNHEDLDLVRKLSIKSNIIVLHDDYFIYEDILIIGEGLGGFSEVSKEFESFIKRINSLIKRFDKIIVITHAPPFKTCLDVISNNNLGNRSYKHFLVKYNKKILLWVSGHFHEKFNTVCKFKNTLLINPGPKGKVITLK